MVQVFLVSAAHLPKRTSRRRAVGRSEVPVTCSPPWYVRWLTQGNDGGSIAKRDDLVRTKVTEQVADKDEVRHSLWSQCRLTKKSLAPPIMVDRLGQLYNKEDVIEYLLRRAQNEATVVENRVAGHLRGLKEVRTATMTRNPAAESSADKQYFPFVCPLTQRLLNGKIRAVCLWPCGCVLSEGGMRTTTGLATLAKDEHAVPCPVCTTPFDPALFVQGTASVQTDVVALNPPEDEQAVLRDQLAQRKTKRKGAHDPAAAKRAKAALPNLNEGAPGAYAANQVRAAQAHAVSHTAKDSDAVASIYRKTASKRDVWLGKGHRT